jgi:AraC-like DNA-binding protein
MPGEGLNAADAASQARWESPFPFDREYRRRFGIPPGAGVAVLDAEAPPAKSS